MDFQENNEQQPEQQDIAIYSKWAILGFSIFFGPLVGGILLMINLRSVGFKRQATGVLLFSVIYHFVAGIVISRIVKLPPNITPTELIQNTQLIISLIAYSLIAQIVGGGILAEYFYKKYFPADIYKYKTVWRPLAVMLIITLTLSLFR